MLTTIWNTFQLVKDSFLKKDPECRKENRFRLAANVADRLGGFRLYKHSHSWYRDEDFLRLWKAFPEGSARIKDKQFATHQLARAISSLPGDTAECGVFRGAGSYLILKATEEQQRIHHVFDSFEGLSEPRKVDLPDDGEAHRWQAGELAVPLDVVKKNLAEFGNRVKYHPGWIPARFSEVSFLRFAFCYVDVDLYEPTRDSVRFFYERMVPGGLIVCDDYGFVDCPGARKAFDDFFSDKPERIVHLTSGQGVVIKQMSQGRTTASPEGPGS